MKKLIIALLSLTILWGCSSVTEDTSKLDTKFTELSSTTANNLELSGKIEISVDGQNFNLNTNIYSAKSDSVLMVLKAFMGIPAAKVYMTPNSFKAFNVIENKAFYGVPSKDNIQKAVNIGFSYKDVVALIRNEPNTIDGYKLNESESNDEEALYYRNFKGEYIEFIKFNLEEKYISQYQQKSAENELLLNVFFEEPKKVGDRNMPSKVTALILENEGKVKFDFEEIKIVENFGTAFDFSIPSNVTKIEL
ncbi:MAG: DUF4292 domain-containing protein [Chlorobiota bacterium]